MGRQARLSSQDPYGQDMKDQRRKPKLVRHYYRKSSFYSVVFGPCLSQAGVVFSTYPYGSVGIGRQESKFIICAYLCPSVVNV